LQIFTAFIVAMRQNKTFAPFLDQNLPKIETIDQRSFESSLEFDMVDVRRLPDRSTALM
jgi:hypothetical protein